MFETHDGKIGAIKDDKIIVEPEYALLCSIMAEDTGISPHIYCCRITEASGSNIIVSKNGNKYSSHNICYIKRHIGEKTEFTDNKTIYT